MRNHLMRVTVLLSVLMFLPTLSGFAADRDAIPETIVTRIEAPGKYNISDRINPFYLRGDFDADGRVDYAVLVEERGTNKKGIVIFLSSQVKLQVLGAGNRVQYGAVMWDDLNFDSWRVYGRSKTDAGTGFAPPPGKDELILVQKKESTSGFFRWTGARFQWIQQGD